MTTLLSKKVISSIKEMLPELREQVKQDVIKWNSFSPSAEFYSDENIIETLPFSVFDYILIKRDIHLDKHNAIELLNMENQGFLKEITAHALRQLAMGSKKSA
jgi:hypothetical protein